MCLLSKCVSQFSDVAQGLLCYFKIVCTTDNNDEGDLHRSIYQICFFQICIEIVCCCHQLCLSCLRKKSKDNKMVSCVALSCTKIPVHCLEAVIDKPIDNIFQVFFLLFKWFSLTSHTHTHTPAHPHLLIFLLLQHKLLRNSF